MNRLANDKLPDTSGRPLGGKVELKLAKCLGNAVGEKRGGGKKVSKAVLAGASESASYSNKSASVAD